MVTLILHVPRTRTKVGVVQSFEETVKSAVGDGYAIYRKFLPVLTKGCKVVLLDKDKKLRSEGKLVKLETTKELLTRTKRHDVHFEEMLPVDYKPESLNRCGVAVVS